MAKIMIKISKVTNRIKKIPWLYIAIISIWLLVFIIMGKRYFNSQQESQKFLKPELVAESIMATAFESMDVTDSYLGVGSRNPTTSNRRVVMFESSKKEEALHLGQEILYTPLGELHAIYDRANGLYTLFYNQLPISQIANPVVLFKFELANKQIVLVLDAKNIEGDWVYSILDIGPKRKELISEVGNYEKLIEAGPTSLNNCIYLKFADARKYTESMNYQIFQYCGTGSAYKIRDVKPEIYYQLKFAHYSPYKVYSLAVNSHCLDVANDEMVLTKECDYGAKYCYMFNALEPRYKDKYYNLLAYVCDNVSTRMLYEGSLER